MKMFDVCYHLPLSYQVQTINMFVLSKLYFRDLHQPFSKSEGKDLRHLISSRFPGISYTTLTTPKHLGVYGMIDLYDHLLGRRAHEVYKVLTQSRPSLNIIIWRSKIQHFLNTVIPAASAPTATHTLHFIPWYEMLFDLKMPHPDYRQFWGLILNSPMFDYSEKAQLEAFYDLTFSLHDRSQAHLTHYSSQAFINLLSLPAFRSDIDRYLQGIDHKPLSPSSFKSVSRRLRLSRTNLRMSSFFNDTFFLTRKQWSSYWSFLQTKKNQYPGKLEHVHLFHLGYYNHKFHLRNQPDPLHPNRHLRTCLFCLQQDSNFQHIWQKIISAGTSSVISSYLLNNRVTDTFLLSLDRYLVVIHRLYSHRRAARQEVSPLSASQLDVVIRLSFTTIL
ncbi:uncharacterized protein RJT21DRAFT_25106 [Scheffersomyces amazonensis]|uniref:uncharacterized protein n=1 Tax=Scheffersomyces amazonensis TaxID=1078765 RepID=UPI00315CA294